MTEKKVIAFDLDDTLCVAKSQIPDRIGELLIDLLKKYYVCIISGGKFEQFRIQVIDRLAASGAELSKLHIMPTCGTRYYRYDDLKDEWSMQYSEDLSSDQKTEIIKTLEWAAKEVDLWEDEPYGEIIEDRDSQVTYSALGQQAPAEKKYLWSEKNAEARMKMRDLAADKLPNLEVRLGGTTSVDVTKIGIDKAYGMQKLIDALDISKEEILFIGDKMQEGGNDYPVKAFGIESIEVGKWQDTVFVLEGILAVS